MGKAHKPPELMAINLAYREGAMTFEQAERAVERIIKELKPRKPTISSGNEKVFEHWWEQEKPSRATQDLENIEKDYRRALAYLGSVPVFGPVREISAALLASETLQGKGVTVHRRAVSRINEMRRGLPRVPKPAKPDRDPRYLTLEQVDKVCTDPTYGLPRLAPFIWTLYGTGCRVGEALALEGMEEGVVMVTQQWAIKERRFKPPKRGKTRAVATLGPAREWIKRWLALPFENKIYHGQLKAVDTIKEACVKLFPKETVHHCSWHDLRHSYAYALLQRGVGLEVIARNLGDRIDTVEEYYTGWKNRLQEAKKLSDLLT